MRALVTGASGFIGASLCSQLVRSRYEVVATSRSRIERPGISYIASPQLGPGADWLPALTGSDVVVHLAGRTQADESGVTPETEAEYRRVNVDSTRSLAHQAVRSGVKHFLFMSSVHAVAAQSDDLITPATTPKPSSAYGRSKLAAERAIKEEFAGSSCAWTILRPPLVYGPGNTANFGLLLKIIKSGLPLPLASVRNRRSFLYIESLVDLILTCLGNPKAFGKVFLPSDGDDASTPALIRAIVRAETRNLKPECSGGGCAARRARLFPFPESLLKVMGLLPGLGALRKLTSSLYVDSEPTRRELGWSPPFTMEEGLRRTLASSARD